jgi:hypothetical protein
MQQIVTTGKKCHLPYLDVHLAASGFGFNEITIGWAKVGILNKSK